MITGILKLRTEFLQVLLGRIGVMLGSLLGIKIMSIYLSVEQMAVLGLALAFSNGASRLLFSPLNQGVLRFTRDITETGQTVDFTSSVMSLFFFRLPVLIPLTLLALYWLPGGLNTILLSALLAMLTGSFIIDQGYLVALRQRIDCAITDTFASFGRPLFALPFFLIIGPAPEYALAGGILSLLVIKLYQLKRLSALGFLVPSDYLVPKLSARNNAQGKALLTYSRPFVAMMAIDLLMMEADKYIISLVMPLSLLGVYVVAQQISRFVPLFIIGFVEQFFYPIFFSGKKADVENAIDRKHIRLTIFVFLVTAAPILALSALTALYSEEIVLLFSTVKFLDGAPLIPFLIAGYALTQSARILQLAGLSKLESQQYVWPKMLQVVVMFGLFFILYPLYGLISIGYAVLASSVVFTMVLLIKNLLLYKNAVQ